MLQKVNETLLKGIIDIHVHSAPDIRPRKFSDIELANSMKKAGARAVVLKSHVVPTMDRAYIAREVTGFEVYGAITLNRPVGGFNPRAVENALLMGAKIVWMPTIDAANDLAYHGKRGGLFAVDGTRLSVGVEDVLKLIAEHKAVLATGHLSVEESYILIDRAKELGIEKVVVDHPELAITQMDILQQQELVDKYGVFLSRCSRLVDLTHAYEVNMEAIGKLGCNSTVLVTDAGAAKLPPWDELMTEYLTSLLDAGVTQNTLDIITKKNPAYLLGLE